MVTKRVEVMESIARLSVALLLGLVIGFDPTRIAAQVVTGIGFLAAGVILREGINVHGINTAATLWCSAMIGTFAGGGFWAPSVVAAGFVVGTNLLLRPLVRFINYRMDTSLTRKSAERRTCGQR
jgi:putative Mg2+ transporter-C (MgtC) family protein